MEKKMEHIGIAVGDIHSAAKAVLKLLDQPDVPIEDHEKDGRHYKIAFIPFGGTQLELIEPVNQKGMAQEHLDQFGPGVYHFALEVPDLDEVVRKLTDRGFEFQGIRTGAAGGRIAFLKEPVLPGIYLEFVEPKKA